MASQNKQETKGFTIIEVVLVLAIAGLIFLMVFIAWPALSRTQRDSQRRDDISLLLRKIKDYQTNNRGALPVGTGTASYEATASGTSWSGFYHDYLGEKFEDPNGFGYRLNVKKCDGSGTVGSACADGVSLGSDATFEGQNGTLSIILQASCDGEKVVTTSNPRKLAVQYKLEGGGIYCADT